MLAIAFKHVYNYLGKFLNLIMFFICKMGDNKNHLRGVVRFT